MQDMIKTTQYIHDSLKSNEYKVTTFVNVFVKQNHWLDEHGVLCWKSKYEVVMNYCGKCSTYKIGAANIIAQDQLDTAIAKVKEKYEKDLDAYLELHPIDTSDSPF